MKKLLILLALLSLTACSTWKSAPERLDRFVEKAEKAAPGYSNQDWQTSKQQYESLISEYSEHEDEYTPEERRLVMKDIGRYHALLIVHNLNDAWAFLKTMIQILPSYWEGVKGVFEEFLDGKKSDISDIVQILIGPEGLSKSIKGLVEDWDTFLEDVSDEVESAVEEFESEND